MYRMGLARHDAVGYETMAGMFGRREGAGSEITRSSTFGTPRMSRHSGSSWDGGGPAMFGHKEARGSGITRRLSHRGGYDFPSISPGLGHRGGYDFPALAPGLSAPVTRYKVPLPGSVISGVVRKAATPLTPGVVMFALTRRGEFRQPWWIGGRPYQWWGMPHYLTAQELGI